MESSMDSEESSLASTSSSEDDEDNFDTLIEKLRNSRKKENRHSEEKVTRLESLLQQQQSEIEDLRKTLKVLKSQEFQKKAKYEETSSAASLTSSESESESDFDDEGIESAPHTSYAEPSHPLMIDPILENIMKHLPLKSLLTSRLVCKKWYKFAHTHLTSKADIVTLEVHQPWKPSRGNKLSKFLEVMKNSIQDCPFQNYVVRNFSKLSDLDTFFRRFGPMIKSLDLNFCREFEDNAAFRRVLFEYALNIKHLRIECCEMLKNDHFWEYSELEAKSSRLHFLQTLYIGNIRGGISLNGNWMKEFLTMTPNVSKLILQVHFKDNGHSFIQTVLDTLLEIRFENLKKIKFLFISSLTEEHLQTLIRLGLADKGLQLHTFKFQDICLPTMNGEELILDETINRFLESQSASLETLKIEQRSNRVRGFSFPKMTALKHLTMISFENIRCGYLNYSELFPCLQSLTLRGYGVFSIPHYFSEGCNSLPAGVNVTSLSLPSGIRQDNFIRFIASLFPNVKQLEIRGASNNLLRSIWVSWPKLEKLKMVLSHYDGYLDPGITGISTEECNRIRINRLYDEVDLTQVQDGPSLSDLKYLRELQIECRSIWIPCSIITDVAGYLTFANMEQLKIFKFTEIGVPEQFDLSDKCIKKIHENLPEAEITFKIMDDHGRWQLELEQDEAITNMYETEPLLEDHNKDKVYCYEKSC